MGRYGGTITNLSPHTLGSFLLLIYVSMGMVVSFGDPLLRPCGHPALYVLTHAPPGPVVKLDVEAILVPNLGLDL